MTPLKIEYRRRRRTTIAYVLINLYTIFTTARSKGTRECFYSTDFQRQCGDPYIINVRFPMSDSYTVAHIRTIENISLNNCKLHCEVTTAPDCHVAEWEPHENSESIGTCNQWNEHSPEFKINRSVGKRETFYLPSKRTFKWP